LASRRNVIGLATALAFVFGVSGQAAAVTFDLDETAAAVAAPVITGGSSVSYNSNAVTLVTVTNAGPEVILHVNVISGDSGDDWQAQNFDCRVTASETVLFVFEPGSSGSDLSYECNLNTDVVDRTPMITRNGIMFISLEDPATGETLNSDQIFADWVVVDYGSGSAFSSGAIAFQGGVPDGGTPDRKYRFDGIEYAQFPAALATNFVAPDYDIDAHLVLFTLDGTAGAANGGPEVSVSVKFYNDDEVQFSAGYTFDCFSIVDLRSIDPRFDASALGSLAGHLTLTPELTNYSDLAHDSQYDGGGVIGVRKTPVHGWIVQTISDGGGGVNGSYTSTGDAAWARTLAQATLPLEPAAGDVPVYGGR